MVMLRTLLVTLQCAAGEGQVDEDDFDAGQRVGLCWTAKGTAPVEAFVPGQSSDGSDARAAVAEACTISGTDARSYSLEIAEFVPVRCPASVDSCPVLSDCVWQFATGALATSLAVLAGVLPSRPDRSGTPFQRLAADYTSTAATFPTGISQSCGPWTTRPP